MKGQNCTEVRPVSMLSFTMQVPWTSTASQGMIIPLLGMTMTSPGTSSVDMACSISSNNIESEYSIRNLIPIRGGESYKYKWAELRHVPLLSLHTETRSTLWAATMSCSMTYCWEKTNSLAENAGKYLWKQPETYNIQHTRLLQGNSALTFLMVYREVAIEMTDMMTMAVA